MHLMGNEAQADTGTDMTCKLSGDTIHPDAVLNQGEYPLPDDNWYVEPLDSDKWGTYPTSLFVQIDDGSGPRWIPVNYSTEQ